MQVQADVYEKIDKQLLTYVEDVLLNRREDATERMLDFASTLDPKSHPTAVKRLGQSENESQEAKITPRLYPIPDGFNPCEVTELPEVPIYKPYRYTPKSSLDV